MMVDTQTGVTGSGPEAKKTVSQVMGEMVWLLTQSPVHKQLFIGDLEWFIMPPILLEQFRIFNGPQHPVAFALWARVSEDTENRLKSGGYKLRPDEWKGGDRAWIIEVVAPFGGHDEILEDMAKNIFPNETFKYHHVNDAGQREVVERAPVSENTH
ncbi:MAG: toxin-activating lysine-acyltransferase [Maricaulis sp.]|jgi:cytolysin-activating lysine-acyltransferase|uniref:toxin-activating lysine-acyltransferase n=1 Tax=Maricaulis sp. TaxID=1486257 RepID=UPI002635123B|nr:toxin-activating lysine-acyltransferase [Maricaulis sp.]MDM7985131.1 toxin-activating lysine-acyltransferase [Maricaulis sp.]